MIFFVLLIAQLFLILGIIPLPVKSLTSEIPHVLSHIGPFMFETKLYAKTFPSELELPPDKKTVFG